MELTPEQIKEREHLSWSGASSIWKREDGWLAENTQVVADRMLTLAGISSGQRVLDVACGTGEPGLGGARLVGQGGAVLGVDFSEEMLAVAREKAARAGLRQIQFAVADAETLTGVTGPFDAATCRWGIMFMPEPVRCLRAVRGLLREGGSLVVATWGPATDNPFIGLIMMVLRRHFDMPSPPPESPGIFAFADEQRLRGVFADAGYREVHVERFSFHMRYRGPEQFYEIQTGIAAPIRDLLARQTEEKREAVKNDVLREADQFRAVDGLRFPAMTWIASATA